MAIKLSFVVPAYNEEHYIGGCVEAILQEIGSRNDCEVVVSDNNSNDRTDAIVSAIAARDPRVILVRETRRGANRTRQTGFETSHGEIVAFIDADTKMPPGWVRRMEAEFSRNPKLVCISGPFVYYDLPKGVRILVRTFFILGYIMYILGRLLFRTTTIVQGGNYAVRRWALDKIGGQDVNIIFYGDDTDLAVRLSRVGTVKFSFKLPILASGRRLAKEGAWTMGVRYAINNFWMVFFRRPYTTVSREIRFSQETVYQPDNKTRERVIAVLFTTVVLLIFCAIAFAIYVLAKDGVFSTVSLAQFIAGKR